MSAGESYSRSTAMAEEHTIGLQPGTIISDKYEVVKCLGAGSMGRVYACRHKELGHLVAIKVLFPDVAQDKTAVARFRNEIVSSYNVNHPNVVRAHEYIRDGDLVAYTMEYIGGGDLAERLGRRDLIEIPEIIRILAQMCSGVQAIHAVGIVHRDLKPENIFLTQDNFVKIGDFGIARTDHGQRLTEHGGVVGTIDYVSPEYMLNSHVDWRSDIYAIGILGYEMIAGESPFRGDSPYATMTLRLKSDPKPPSAIRKECPLELDQIILKAMHRNPELRYQSAKEMCLDLLRLASSMGIGLSSQDIMMNDFSMAGVKKNTTPTGQIQSNVLTHSEVAQNANEQTATTSRPIGPYFVQNKALKDPVDVFSGGTETFPARVVVGLNDQDDPGSTHDPIEIERMEPVLDYKDPVVDSWSSPNEVAQSPEIRARMGTGGENRLKRLSTLADKVNRSIWVDIVTLVVAVLIGIGVGFAFLRVFFPELLSHKSTSSTKSFDIRALSDD